MTDHPYARLPPKAFWRTAVATGAPLSLDGLWTPKFDISATDRIITAGSCFAQHISRALQAAGYAWFNAEPGPVDLPDPARFNYGVFSFRTGNIYTPALLRQWIEWSLAEAASPADDLEIWEQDGRYYDAFRPLIEPNGFASPEEVRIARKATFSAVRRALEADLLVFTLGLTEAWQNSETGLFYPACPGTLAGTFDPGRHRFVNFDFSEIESDLKRAIQLARTVNPRLRVLLTVSPVPLTATASGDHVLVATTYSKSVLRAVAGQVARADPAIDYFPSFEIITSPATGGMYFAENLREITPAGVARVMSLFFGQTAPAPSNMGAQAPGGRLAPPAVSDDDVACEDILLEAFNRHA